MIIEGEYSIYVPIEFGMPQWSVLDPSLFLYYVNDILVSCNTITDIYRKHHITYLAINSTIDAEHLQKKNL